MGLAGILGSSSGVEAHYRIVLRIVNVNCEFVAWTKGIRASPFMLHDIHVFRQ